MIKCKVSLSMRNCPKRIYFNMVTNWVKVKVMSGHVQGHLKVTCTLQVVWRIASSVCNFISHSVKSNVFFCFLLFQRLIQYQPTKVEDNSCCWSCWKCQAYHVYSSVVIRVTKPLIPSRRWRGGKILRERQCCGRALTNSETSTKLSIGIKDPRDIMFMRHAGWPYVVPWNWNRP